MNTPVRVGILDIGSNAIRAEVFELQGHAVRAAESTSELTYAGKQLFTTGHLDIETQERLFAVMGRLDTWLAERGVARTIAVATAVFREAVESPALFERCSRELNIDIRLLSGQEEAVLIARGVHANRLQVEGPYLLIDIGGGSTEMSLCEAGAVLRGTSIPCGTSRFAKGSDLLSGDGEVRRRIRHLLDSEPDIWAPVGTLVGSSNTLRTLHAFLHKPIRADGLSGALTGILHSSAPFEVLSAGLPGVQPAKLETLAVGLVILAEVVARCGADEFIVSKYSLRHGVLAEFHDSLQS